MSTTLGRASGRQENRLPGHPVAGVGGKPGEQPPILGEPTVAGGRLPGSVS
jgi:hypothetical protein